jgi:hypothetical protein
MVKRLDYHHRHRSCLRTGYWASVTRNGWPRAERVYIKCAVSQQIPLTLDSWILSSFTMSHLFLIPWYWFAPPLLFASSNISPFFPSAMSAAHKAPFLYFFSSPSSLASFVHLSLHFFIPWYWFSPPLLFASFNISFFLLSAMSAAHILSMHVDHKAPFLHLPSSVHLSLHLVIPLYWFSPPLLFASSNISAFLPSAMSAVHMLSMVFDHKAFIESSLNSFFNYMDSRLDKYPPPSPTLGVSVGRQFFIFLLVHFSRF